MALDIKISLKIIKVTAVVGIEASKKPPIQKEGKANKSNLPFKFVSGSSLILIVAKANLTPVVKNNTINMTTKTIKIALLPLVSTGDTFSPIMIGSVIKK